MLYITHTDILEAIAGFTAWMVIAKILKYYLNFSSNVESALVWSLTWLSQKVIKGILENNLTPRDIANRKFLNGKGLETLREIHCRTNPQDEICGHFN